MRELRLPRDESPRSAHDRALRHEAFFLAAQIALQFGLGRDKVLRAARLAISRYLERGDRDMALYALRVFGITAENRMSAKLTNMKKPD